MVGDDMKGKLLPIGTVVSIKGGTKKVMITGYYSQNVGDSKIYTYNGCIFPEGFMENTFLLFDQPEIDEIIYKGLENDDYDKYVEKVDGNYSVSNGKGLEAPVMDGGRTSSHIKSIKAPTNPLSSSEMKAKYTKEVISGGQTKKFDFSKLKK